MRGVTDVRLDEDLQASPPEIALALSRAGVTGVQKAVRIRRGDAETVMAAVIDCTVDLANDQKGVHMSRFPELFEEAIELVPIATHNQRGRGTLFVGTEHDLDAEVIVDIVERSMSAPIYDLLKRPDELFVVEHAHLQPRFVEDSVRHALRDALDTLPWLDEGDFLLSKQVNFETIHTHDVVAERFGTVGELRTELGTGEATSHQTTLAAWLAG